jgi:transposase
MGPCTKGHSGEDTMPFKRTKAELVLSQKDRIFLENISQSRTEEVRRVERAHMLLRYVEGWSVPQIAKQLNTNPPKVYRCIDKALEFGVQTAVRDLKRSGRLTEITPEAKTWIISLACQKPKELGYSYELWTTRLLSQHIRENAGDQGSECRTYWSL